MRELRRSSADISRSHSSLSVLLLLFFLIQPLQSVFDSGVAQATAVPWSEPNGTANDFDWENGGSDKGLFGNPLLVGGDTFIFFPSNFRAESINGNSALVGDRLQFGIIAHSGKEIKGIRITEYGDYGILNTGSVSVTGTLFLINLSHFGVHYDDLITEPNSPISSGQGTWTANVAVDDIDWTHLNVVLNNNLMAISVPGSTVFIEKKIVGGAVDIEIIIPEPATICLLGMGALSLIVKKK